MNKLEYALRIIQNCHLCNGSGMNYWSNGEDYDFESCPCNPYDLILDEGEVIWDNGLLSEEDLSLFNTAEAL